jgi:hypothetical protein
MEVEREFMIERKIGFWIVRGKVKCVVLLCVPEWEVRGRSKESDCSCAGSDPEIRFVYCPAKDSSSGTMTRSIGSTLGCRGQATRSRKS